MMFRFDSTRFEQGGTGVSVFLDIPAPPPGDEARHERDETKLDEQSRDETKTSVGDEAK